MAAMNCSAATIGIFPTRVWRRSIARSAAVGRRTAAAIWPVLPHGFRGKNLLRHVSQDAEGRYLDSISIFQPDELSVAARRAGYARRRPRGPAAHRLEPFQVACGTPLAKPDVPVRLRHVSP